MNGGKLSPEEAIDRDDECMIFTLRMLIDIPTRISEH